MSVTGRTICNDWKAVLSAACRACSVENAVTPTINPTTRTAPTLRMSMGRIVSSGCPEHQPQGPYGPMGRRGCCRPIGGSENSCAIPIGAAPIRAQSGLLEVAAELGWMRLDEGVEQRCQIIRILEEGR